MEPSTWSEQDLCILKQNYGRIPTESLAWVLEKSLPDVYGQAARHGLTDTVRKSVTSINETLNETIRNVAYLAPYQELVGSGWAYKKQYLAKAILLLRDRIKELEAKHG